MPSLKTPATLASVLVALQTQGLDRLDAQLLLLHVLGQPLHARAWLLAHDSDPLPPAAQAILAACVQRRLRGEPLAYICGQKEFFGLNLTVDPRVLVPRPDTETLVEWALAEPLHWPSSTRGPIYRSAPLTSATKRWRWPGRTRSASRLRWTCSKAAGWLG
jgi:methylase of polypeptide subunit release factors